MSPQKYTHDLLSSEMSLATMYRVYGFSHIAKVLSNGPECDEVEIFGRRAEC